MKNTKILIIFFAYLVLPRFCYAEVLPSWQDGLTKSAIQDFVIAVTSGKSINFVPPSERIAVFDNDGTLWSEQPAYFQLLFAIDRVNELAPKHPEWKEQQPFKDVLEGDMKGLASSGEKGLLELVLATHSGMTTDEFEAIVSQWLKTARHPTLNKPFTDLVFKPMLELLDYLRANDFRIFIVSGGGIEFMRPWVNEVYGIPPDQVVGSSIVTEFEMRDGQPVLIRKPKLNFINDKLGKPVGINMHIGQRPIFSFGNSDGDLQMLQWTTITDKGERFAGIIHHTDEKREFAYDSDSSFGRLDKALTEAKKNGWTIVDMKKDWKVVYP